PESGPDDRLERARAAVVDWQADRGEVDATLMEFVREVRAAGLPVALCANASDVLDSDLELLELKEEFDVIVNSSTVGERKPSKEYFAAAATMLRVPPDECLLLEEADRVVSGARVAGVAAYRFTGQDDLRYVRAALGLTQVS
ncbi:MAG: HAD-IA family hydrolase, partial [Longispora sp.]|nr:HAD-IA family hydrolase [Longispora sp. (in: high G+C Gram-positive bacteria)]